MINMSLGVNDLLEAEEVNQMHHGAIWVIMTDCGINWKIRVKEGRGPTRVELSLCVEGTWRHEDSRLSGPDTCGGLL